MKDFAGWVPIRIHWKPDGLKVDWAFLDDLRFTDPFFEQTVGHCLRHPANLLFRHETSMATLAELNESSPGLPPAGFIFHGSRCGSTLISRMLAALPENVVISEASPIDAVLRSHLRDPAITEEQRILWLRGLLNALGQRRHAEEKSMFVKFDSWHTLFLPVIQRAFPSVPWIFVYREPVEVLMSQSRQRGGQMIPGVLEPAIFGWDEPSLRRMSLSEYGGRVLARIGEAALEEARAGRGRLVNYRQLPGVVWPSLMRHWGADCAEQMPETVARVCRFHAKNPALIFEDDAQAKRRSGRHAAIRPPMARRGLPTTGNGAVGAGPVIRSRRRVRRKQKLAQSAVDAAILNQINALVMPASFGILSCSFSLNFCRA